MNRGREAVSCVSDAGELVHYAADLLNVIDKHVKELPVQGGVVGVAGPHLFPALVSPRVRYRGSLVIGHR